MKITKGKKFRDYMGVPYVVKEYKNSIITFEVDGGNEKDEKYTKSEFLSEIDGARFHEDLSVAKKEITKEVIKNAAISYSQNHTYKFVSRTSFMDGVKWYQEQLKNN